MELQRLPSVLLLSKSQLETINSHKKRPIQPDGWKDVQAKDKKNAGEPYVPRSKRPKPGKIGPQEVNSHFNIK
jgi:hypothetical protein